MLSVSKTICFAIHSFIFLTSVKQNNRVDWLKGLWALSLDSNSLDIKMEIWLVGCWESALNTFGILTKGNIKWSCYL